MRGIGVLVGGGAGVLLAALAAKARAEEILGVTADNALIAFDSDHPESILRALRISGTDDFVMAIAVRPSDDQLFALTDQHRLYRIERRSGLATPIGATPIVPALAGDVSMSFDPGTGMLRVVTSSGQNLRVNSFDGTTFDGDPTTPGLQGDRPLVYAGDDVAAARRPFVAAIAHARGVSSVGSTAFVIDAAFDSLARLGVSDATGGSRDAGVLHTVGLLGVDVDAELAGFDVSAATGVAYGAFTLTNETSTHLYVVSLLSGAATQVGLIGVPEARIRAIAVDPLGADLPAPTVLVALTQNGELVRFATDDPTKIRGRATIKGLVPGDSLAAIALRPATGRLYGLSPQGRLYVINASTGVVRAVSATPFEIPLSGTRFAMDFPPSSGVARVVSDTGMNFRVATSTGAVVDSDPNTPGVQPDADLRFKEGDELSGSAPNLSAIAFVRTTTGSTLFGISPESDMLVQSVDSPTSGVLRSVGPLEFDATGPVGFEIFDETTAFATFGTSGGASHLWSVDLATGSATDIGSVGSSESILSIAAAPTSNPRTFKDDLFVQTMSIRLNLRAESRDSIVMTGSLPRPDAGIGGQDVVVDVGGFSHAFTLNANGVARDGKGTSAAADDDTFQLIGPPTDGRVGFVATLRRESIADDLADEGMSGDATVHGAARTVRVTITIDGVEYATDVTLRYSAIAGRSAVAVRP
jgi:hypothetical protein